jgi:hypothetical protein
LHLESIGVGPESLVGLEAVVHLPVDSDVLCLFIVDWDSVELNLELNELSKDWRSKHLDDGLLMVVGVVEKDCPLLNEVTFLVNNVLNKLTVGVCEWVSPLRSEDVGAITRCIIGNFLLSLFVKILPIELSSMLDVALVFLETNSECLVEILGWVLILEENFASLSEAGDLQSWVLGLLLNQGLR